MITKMTRYDFILLSGETDDFLKKLQDSGVVDITRSVKAIDEQSAQMAEKADALKKRITFLRSGNYSQDKEYADLQAKISALTKERSEISHWGEFTASQIKALENEGVVLKFYKVSKKQFDAAWADAYPLTIIEDNGSSVWFVVSGENDIPLAPLATPSKSASDIDVEMADLKGLLQQRASALAAEDANALEKEYRQLLGQLDIHCAKAATSLAVEDSISLITGFTPCENDAALQAMLEKDGVFYMSADAAVEDNPPIKLKNNRFVQMFEVLTDMYGRPAYDGFDPTPYISIFFLLFFAMCMGDAGYGLILIIVGLLLRKAKGFASLAPLVITLGTGTAIVGFFFHTFFSIDISQWNCIPDALKSIMVPAKIATYDGTMILALIVGIIHLCLAMIVKTVYATRNKGFLNCLGTWGWTLFIVGCVILGGISLAGVIDAALTKTIIIVLGCISALGIFLLNDLHRNPLLNIGSGLWETYNTVTGLLGDVLSYLRLYALGLAGGMLGFAFNDLGNMVLSGGGIGGWIGFILIVLVGHTLNVAMAALGAFVHPLRLNFLEFFKNSDYDGSGRKYNPLKK